MEPTQTEIKKPSAPTDSKPGISTQVQNDPPKLLLPKEIVKNCDETLQINPNDINAWVKKALALTKLFGKRKVALVCFDKVILFKNTVAASDIDECYDALCKIAEYDRAIQLKPEAPAAYKQKCHHLVSENKLEEAIQYYEKALNKEGVNDPIKRFEAFLEETTGLIRNQSNRAGVRFYERAIELNPNDKKAYELNCDALLCLLGEDPSEMLSIFEKISKNEKKRAQIDPDSDKETTSFTYAICSQTAINCGSFETAIKLIDEAFLLFPAARLDFRLLNFKGTALTALGRPQEALAYFDQSLANEENEEEEEENSAWRRRKNLFGLTYKAEALTALGKHDEALACLDKGSDYMGDEDDERLFWHIKAIVLVNLGRNEEAVELFQEGWISPSSNSNVAVLHTVKQQGDILARIGQPQGAADRYHWVACDMNSNHNAKEAIALYSKAITTAPTNGSSYFSLISCLQEKGQDEAALEICEKGLQAIPNHDLLYLQKAAILRCLGQKEAAILSMEKACQCNSNNEEEIHHKKGELLYIYGEYEAAIRCFNESIEIISKKLLGKEEELKKKYSEAHNLEKDRREIYHDKGLALYVLKRFEEAIACFDITNQPESRDLFTLSVPRFHPKGRALAALGKYEQAISCFDDALEDDVTNFQYALISLYKGELLSKMGKEQEALDCFEQAEYVVHYFPPKTSLHQNDIDIRFRYGVAFPSQEREILCKHLFEMQQAVVEVEAKKLDETVKKLDKLKEEKNTLITEFIQRVDDYSRNITSANYELRKKLADMKERILNLLQNQQTGTEQESKEKFKMDQIDSDKGPKQWVEVGASDRSACCNLFSS